jgi:hypothetical protein
LGIAGKGDLGYGKIANLLENCRQIQNGPRKNCWQRGNKLGIAGNEIWTVEKFTEKGTLTQIAGKAKLDSEKIAGKGKINWEFPIWAMEKLPIPLQIAGKSKMDHEKIAGKGEIN